MNQDHGLRRAPRLAEPVVAKEAVRRRARGLRFRRRGRRETGSADGGAERARGLQHTAARNGDRHGLAPASSIALLRRAARARAPTRSRS